MMHCLTLNMRKAMKDKIKVCEDFRDVRSTPSVSEKGKTFQLDNRKSKIEIAGIKIDGCVFTKEDGKKCDYLFEVEDKKKLFFVELKGSDVIQAIEQIKNTITKMKVHYNDWSYAGRVVLGRRVVPDIKDRKEFKALYQEVNQDLKIYHTNTHIEEV